MSGTKTFRNEFLIEHTEYNSYNSNDILKLWILHNTLVFLQSLQFLSHNCFSTESSSSKPRLRGSFVSSFTFNHFRYFNKPFSCHLLLWFLTCFIFTHNSHNSDILHLSFLYLLADFQKSISIDKTIIIIIIVIIRVQ